MIKKLSYSFASLLVIIGIVYAFGPRPSFVAPSVVLPNIQVAIGQLDSFINAKEIAVSDLKQDNQARIIWADSIGKKTNYAVVYLHGFSASQEEGDPIHEEFAKRYGCNLFLTRLFDHGRLDSNSFINLTPQKYMASALEALAIGQKLGDRVILMSCSTGSTLAIFLAAHHPELIAAQIMYSPNIDLADASSIALTLPWGKQIAQLSFSGNYNRIRYSQEAAQYWNEVYHINGIIAVKSLIESTMTKDVFSKIKHPLFLGYYYKNNDEQDQVVSVPKMKDFFLSISTPEEQKRMVPFPTAGRHVIASHVLSNDCQTVMHETFNFAEDILGLVPITRE